MQALRTFVWIVIAVVLTIFAVANSQVVAVAVWPGYVAELPLSVLIILVFMLGFVPPLLINIGNRWRLGRQITMQEQVIAQLRTPTPAPTTSADAGPAPGPVTP